MTKFLLKIILKELLWVNKFCIKLKEFANHLLKHILPIQIFELLISISFSLFSSFSLSRLFSFLICFSTFLPPSFFFSNPFSVNYIKLAKSKGFMFSKLQIEPNLLDVWKWGDSRSTIENVPGKIGLITIQVLICLLGL